MDEQEADEMMDFVDMATKLIHDTPQLKEFFGISGKLALDDSHFQDPKEMYSYAFLLGFAKAMHDISAGYINISTVKIDKGDTHENNQEPDNPLTRRNRSAQDEQGNKVAGE